MGCECKTHAQNYAYNRAQTPGLVTEVFWCEESQLDDNQRGWEVIVWPSEAARKRGSTTQISGARRFYPCKHPQRGYDPYIITD